MKFLANIPKKRRIKYFLPVCKIIFISFLKETNNITKHFSISNTFNHPARIWFVGSHQKRVFIFSLFALYSLFLFFQGIYKFNTKKGEAIAVQKYSGRELNTIARVSIILLQDKIDDRGRILQILFSTQFPCLVLLLSFIFHHSPSSLHLSFQILFQFTISHLD